MNTRSLKRTSLDLMLLICLGFLISCEDRPTGSQSGTSQSTQPSIETTSADSEATGTSLGRTNGNLRMATESPSCDGQWAINTNQIPIDPETGLPYLRTPTPNLVQMAGMNPAIQSSNPDTERQPQFGLIQQATGGTAVQNDCGGSTPLRLTVGDPCGEGGMVVCNGPNDIRCEEGRHITICHIPPGNPSARHTITVGAPAVRAHLALGAMLGPCEELGIESTGENGDATDTTQDPPESEGPLMHQSEQGSRESERGPAAGRPAEPGRRQQHQRASDAQQAGQGQGRQQGQQQGQGRGRGQ